MANKRHLAFALDREKWAKFRAENSGVRPDLRDANLAEANLVGDFSGVRFDGAYMKGAYLPVQLRGATFVNAELRYAHFSGAAEVRDEFDRRDTVFRDAHMSDCNMRDANFEHADFSGADLRGARFDGALLTSTNFTGANLEDARFDGASLGGAIFSGARLKKTNFRRTVFDWTIFDAVDLSGAEDLELAEHRAPSAVTLATAYRSGGRVAESFLLGTQPDVPEDVIMKLRDLFRTLPFQYWSCFVSYANDDSEFVDRLAARLERAGVSFWRDRASIRAGEAYVARIEQAIRRYDRFIVVLSSHAVKSTWVRREVELALKRKRYDILPIRVDDSVLVEDDGPFAALIRERHVADFSHWREPRAFSEQVKRLVSALRRT